MTAQDLTPLPDGTKSSNSVSEDIRDLILKAYPLDALLTGALALLESELDDAGIGSGNLYAVQHIIQVAKEKASDIWMHSDDIRLIARAARLEERCAG